MNDPCWYTVKIDVGNAINPLFERPTPIPDKQFQMWAFPANEIFSAEWLEYTKSLGLIFQNGFIFYKYQVIRPSAIHIDVPADPTKKLNFGFNWVFSGGEGSKMIWYEYPKKEPEVRWITYQIPVKNSKTEWVTSSTPYVDCGHESQLTVIDEYEIKNKLTLVSTGIPHDVYNVPKDRWCMTARIDIPQETTWDYIVDYLNERNLLEPREV